MNKTFLAVLLLCTAVAARADMGVAKIAGTAAGSAVAGSVSFEDSEKGLKVSATLHGLTPGQHGFHIHEWGNCDDSAKAAGGHFNPAHASHGEVLKNGPQKAHAGDMGNIVADDKGDAKLDVVVPGVGLSGGKFLVAGRAVVVHEKGDDFSQPAGNAGGRIACGVIGLTGPVAAPAAPAAPAAAPAPAPVPAKP